MADVVVLGGGVCGLASALLLARDGHEVTVLEHDPDPVPGTPEEAWAQWHRGGVAQFRQPHYLQPRARLVLDAELPDVSAALAAAHAVRFDTLTTAPPTVPPLDRRPDDDRHVTLTARRCVLEQVLGRTADEQPGMRVRRGVTVTGLLTRPLDGRPHVTGVATTDGEVAADLVVDATGRRSPLPRWLLEAGSAPVQEESVDSGFTYYTRYFRSRDGRLPEPRDRLNVALGSFSVLTLPADSGTWSVTLYTASSDRPLKELRHEPAWTAVVAACPRQAHWLDGEPLTGVLPMTGILDRHRRLSDGERPVATGIAPLADAWACTNPSIGRGIALGLVHAVALREVVRQHLGDPEEFAAAWDADTEARLTPWYRATVAVDRARLADMDAAREGRPPPSPPPPPAPAALGPALVRAMAFDAEVYRAFMEVVDCLTLPAELFTRPGFADRVLQVAGEHEHPPPAGPTRERLLELVGAT
ncbi:NAD(P)/FAD-dependent oxidoreductase [Geodermatophilus sp. SYSU D00814]